MSWGTLSGVRDGSGDPQGGPLQIGGHSQRFGTGQWTLGKFRDGSGTHG